MSSQNIFDGHDHTPSREQVFLLVKIIEYLNIKYSLPQSYFYKNGIDIKEDTLGNTKKHNKYKMNPVYFKEYTRLLHGYIFSNDRYVSLDRYIIPAVKALYPESASLFSDESQQDICLIAEHANTNPISMTRLLKKFENGAYIYRYAKNDNNGDAKRPRAARGHLSLSPSPAPHYAHFDIYYNPGRISAEGTDILNRISGRVYSVHAFYFFLGTEQHYEYPFCMSMAINLTGNIFGGLIMRKHPNDQGFFSSKVYISQIEKAQDNPSDNAKGYHIDEIEALTDLQRKNLLNVGTNDGAGLLFAPDSRR